MATARKIVQLCVKFQRTLVSLLDLDNDDGQPESGSVDDI